MTSSNPFVHGYDRFTTTRTLIINQRHSGTFHRRQLHTVHAAVPDFELDGLYCKCNDKYALIPELGADPLEMQTNFPFPGYIAAVVYSVAGFSSTRFTHIGDAPNPEAAEALIGQLSFESGHFNRCWEISWRHVPRLARHWIHRYAQEKNQPPNVFFQAYEIPTHHRGHSLGFLLRHTPWTDSHLSDLGVDSQSLRKKQRAEEIPTPLIDILHLAANADTRVLILDAFAPVLAGLPLVD